MRRGTNPEKIKEERNVLKKHRVILPVYIPNTEEEYYSESLEVFETCLRSLLNTINPSLTAVTVVNNNSTQLLQPILKKYKNRIDKQVDFIENRGKIYAVLSEAKSSYEPFITIADADVLYFPGWEKEVFDIFETYPKAGIVTPLPTPNTTFTHNCCLFFDHYLRGSLKYGKIVSDNEVELYTRGLNYPVIINRDNRKFSWKDKQYFLNGRIKAVAGAAHFVATYRTFLFKNVMDFPENKFKNGDEDLFLDSIADKKGFYRLSVTKCYAYHMGNKLENIPIYNLSEEKMSRKKFEKIKMNPAPLLVPFWIKKMFFKALKKIIKL